MGMFFSSVSIKLGVDRAQFLDCFCGFMKSRGFAPCAESEAAISCLLAFSSQDRWSTISCGEYDRQPKKARQAAAWLAQELGTDAFAVESVDSDFAQIDLYTGDNIHDTAIAGQFEFDEAPKGSRNCWEPLLAPGKTWEQLSDALEQESCFVEDNLRIFASCLGIEPEYLAWDYELLLENTEGNSDILQMHFQKAAI